jgi:hypothetical protein
MAQRHEQADLELVGIDQPCDDLARDFLADALPALGTTPAKGRVQLRVRELLVGLRERGARHVEIRGRDQRVDCAVSSCHA